MTETIMDSAAETTRLQNVGLVEKMYECFNRGDMATIKAEVFAPDMVWHLPGRSPVGGTKNGPDEVIAFFGGLVSTGIKVDLARIDAWGDDTVVEVHRGHGTSNGATLDALNCTHYRIENGRIKEVQVYLSDQYGADNFFWATFQLARIPDRWAK
ncbi:MAG TPA: nuclear transport factor 2 family protein [Pseudonocardiaceae bacterium]|nr:nuclear transport factor 2 family protein [Pseudonocardiaceae bacterium]